MRVLIIDSDHTGLDMAYRAAEAGHEVRWWMSPKKDRSRSRSGDGFPKIEKVLTWQPHMAWAKQGLVVNLYNDRKITAELDRWRSFGSPVFGPSVKSAKLEWERASGMKFMQEHGIEIPPFHTFKTLDECIKFAWRAQEPFVFKTAGDVEDKSLSYVASDPADLVSFLEKKKADGLTLKGEMYLQQKIDMLSEVGVSAWMGKNGFLPEKFNVNFEFKKFMAGEFGPATGEQGTVTKYCKEGLMPDLLMKFEKALVKLGHIGDFDIGCGIDKKGKIWPFEFSARFGFPSTPILMACHEGDPVQWMRDAILGRDTLKVDERTAMGVIMTRPPYPTKNEDPASAIGYRIDGIEDVWESVAPGGMMLDTGPTMGKDGLTKGKVYKTTDDYICTVTAQGSDVHDVIPQVYAAIDRIKFSDRQVRNDVGKKLEHELPKLKALGFNELPDW